MRIMIFTIFYAATTVSPVPHSKNRRNVAEKALLLLWTFSIEGVSIEGENIYLLFGFSAPARTHINTSRSLIVVTIKIGLHLVHSAHTYDRLDSTVYKFDHCRWQFRQTTADNVNSIILEKISAFLDKLFAYTNFNITTLRSLQTAHIPFPTKTNFTYGKHGIEKRKNRMR